MSELTSGTALTGFLGSGKSTLLRRVLTEFHGRRVALIENEFGEENIDREIIVSAGRATYAVESATIYAPRC
jgi:G3E family GTPase